jgi:cytidylate kinase
VDEMRKISCVAIDGPSSSGKSTVAKAVAKELGFFHIDSGAIYRALAWWMDKHVDALANLDSFVYSIQKKGDKVLHFVADIDVTGEIRSPYISQKSSEIATISEVRRKVTEIQRVIAKGRSVVIEGRDIGSVVFPNAEVKIFLTADSKERARRRYEELKLKGGIDTLEEVERDLIKRDLRDRTREDSPLVCPEGASIVDTTYMSPNEVIEKICNITKRKMANPIWKFLVGEERSGANFVYKCMWLFSYLWYKVFYKIEVKGLENYPEGSLIVAPNHSSFLDPPAIGIACPSEVHCLAKVYLFKNKIMKWLLPKINTHPVSGDASDLSVLKMTSDLLFRGKQVIIFPEGTRSSDNQILPLKRGVALLASNAKCKVIPVSIKGAYEAWPKGRKTPKFFGKIIVEFGVPLDWKNYEKLDLSKKEAQAIFTTDLQNALKTLGGNL